MSVPYQEVKLTSLERLIEAPIMAVKRWTEALERGYPDKHGLSLAEDGLALHYWGVCGEIAYGKARNVYVTLMSGTFKAPDVGTVQIRTRTKHNYELIIREDDSDSEFFVLVTVNPREPALFRVYGGIFAHEAKSHPEWKQSHGGREPAWFVPQLSLNGHGWP
jgi:hypothetical protein